LSKKFTRQQHTGLPRLLLVVFAALVSLWPAFLNGHPFLFADTSAYVRAVDAAVVKVGGQSTIWTRDGEIERLSASSSAVATSVPASDQNRVPLLGRSIYYGALAYASALTGSFWPLAFLQGLALGVAALLLHKRLMGTLEGASPTRLAALLLVLAGCTTAPFFCSFVMPDLFAGLSIIATALLLTEEDARVPRDRWTCFAIAAAGALFHASHILLLLGLAALALAVHLITKAPVSRIGLALVAAAGIVGLTGEATFVRAVTHATGQSPVRPPFVTARLIDDGPGYQYLRETCPGNRFYACRFLDRLPLQSDLFLWSQSAANGVFNTLNTADKRRLASEQTRFVAQVFADRPLDVTLSSLGSAIEQLGRFQLNEFNYPGVFDPSGLPQAEQAKVRETRAMRGEIPTRSFGILASIVAALSLAALVPLVRQSHLDWRLAALVVSGILLNALICGALSTPHDRYGARVLWLLPMIAAAALVNPRPSWNASAWNRRLP
jgi:hypothetical protein